jgi:hypothetical protein
MNRLQKFVEQGAYGEKLGRTKRDRRSCESSECRWLPAKAAL